MTYFDPEIYNEENLNANDKAEIQFWKTEFENAVYEAEFNMFTAEEKDRDIFDQMKTSAVREYAEHLKNSLESRIMEYITARIENYTEEEETEKLFRIPEDDTPIGGFHGNDD